MFTLWELLCCAFSARHVPFLLTDICLFAYTRILKFPEMGVLPVATCETRISIGEFNMASSSFSSQNSSWTYILAIVVNEYIYSPTFSVSMFLLKQHKRTSWSIILLSFPLEKKRERWQRPGVHVTSRDAERQKPVRLNQIQIHLRARISTPFLPKQNHHRSPNEFTPFHKAPRIA